MTRILLPLFLALGMTCNVACGPVEEINDRIDATDKLLGTLNKHRVHGELDIDIGGSSRAGIENNVHFDPGIDARMRLVLPDSPPRNSDDVAVPQRSPAIREPDGSIAPMRRVR